MSAVLAEADGHGAWLEPLFDVAFTAPDGMARLRQLILTLAMQGKLVPQVASEAPASTLLKQIAAEKSAPAGKRHAVSESSPISGSEKPYTIPGNWEWVRLGEITDIIRGITFPASEKTKEPAPGRIACLRTANVQKEIEWQDLLYIDREFMSKSSQLIRRDDIVMSMANSRELVGKVAIVKDMPVEEATFGGFLGVLRTHKVMPLFVLHLLNTKYARGTLVDAASQTTNIANISLGKLNPFLVPLPPLEEQKRIVARIDELMSCCDVLESLRSAQESKRRGARAAAVRQWLAGDDVAAALLGEHFATLINTREDVAELRKAVLQLAMTGKLVAHARPIPNEPLKELASKIGSGSTPSGGKEAYQKSGIPLIRSMNVHFDGFKYDGLAFINDAQAAKLNNVIVQAGDVLLNITGASIGRVTIAPDEMSGARVNQHVCIIRSTEKLDARYLLACLASPFTQELIFDVQVGATREALTKSMIEKFQIPLPPLPEQKRIIARMDELMRLCDTLESLAKEAEGKQVELLDAVMARAH